MNSRGPAGRRSRYKPVWAVFRAVAVTFLATLLAFCISLFFGIVGVLLTKMIRGTPTPDLDVAYRHIAFPIAIAALVVTFVVALITEVRQYRQERDRDAIPVRPRKAV
jgi:TRAP-type C4-dicarboxylate transport system permease small subunit